MSIGANLRAWREYRKLSQETLAQRAGVVQGTISQLELKLNAESRKLSKIAAALSISVEQLLNEAPPSDGNKALPYGESNVAPAPALRSSSRVAIVGTVKGGDDGFLMELEYATGYGDGYVEYWVKDPAAYALRIRGDSMNPRYRAGEFVVVTPGIEASSGMDVVVKLVNEKKLLKQLNWIRGDEIQLMSVNNDYAPMTLQLADVETIHRVAGSVPADAFQP